MSTELVRLALEHAPVAGLHPTALPALQVLRADRPADRIHSLHRPSLCFLAQGSKEISVGELIVRYRTHQFLFTTLELPVVGEILEAAPGEPYLCLVLEVDPTTVFELVAASQGLEPRRVRAPGPAMVVGEPDGAMTDAFTRLLRCLHTPLDARVLSPSILREIVYRLLRGPFGDTVRELGVADSQTQRIAAVIQHLKADYARPLRTSDLARIAGMSVSSFHEHFRRVTTLSPLQYQKQLRLAEARRLLVGHTATAAAVAFADGYESPSQFSREYARL
ncbi:MAG: AraC family transcriptional regulator, partial [Myxococcales bacterium]